MTRTMRRQVSVRTALLVATAVCLALVRPAGAAPGQLDTTFGESGTAWAPFEACPCYGNTIMATTPDGKIVGLGQNNLARFLSNGSLDPTFGSGGVVSLGALAGVPLAVLVDHAGRTVVAGYTSPYPSVQVLRLWRYDTHGVPDQAFAERPRPVTGFIPVGIAEQSIGGVQRYVVGGRRTEVARFNENGQLDTTFGRLGLGHGDTHAIWKTSSLTLDPRTSAIILGGITPYAEVTSVLRFTANGRVDSGFGDNGVASAKYTRFRYTAYGAVGVAVSPAGAIYATEGVEQAQPYPSGVGIWRFTSSGAIDTTFGTNGEVITAFTSVQDEPFAVVVQQDGRVVVSGADNYTVVAGDQGYAGHRFEISRYEPTGALDPTFGSGGFVLGGEGMAVGLRLDRGKILIAGGMLQGPAPPGVRMGLRIARYNG